MHFHLCHQLKTHEGFLIKFYLSHLLEFRPLSAPALREIKQLCRFIEKDENHPKLLFCTHVKLLQ